MKLLFCMLPLLFVVGCGTAHQVLFEQSAEDVAIKGRHFELFVKNETTLDPGFEIDAATWEATKPGCEAAFREELGSCLAKGGLRIDVEVSGAQPGAYTLGGIRQSMITGSITITEAGRVVYSANFTGMSSKGWESAGLQGRMESAFREVAHQLAERLKQ